MFINFNRLIIPILLRKVNDFRVSQVPSLIFKHNFDRTVWQMALEPQKGLLAIELRDHKEAEVSFSLLALHPPVFRFDGYVFEEGWWMSLAALKGNTLLVKKYLDSQQPEKQALLAVNVDSLDVEWWLDHFQLMEIGSDTVLGWQGEGEARTYTAIDVGGPKVESDAWDSVRKVTSENAEVNALYPTHYPEESAHFGTVRSFILDVCNIEPIGAFDYLEVGGLIIISWFYSEGSSMANELLVVNDQGQIVTREKLGTGLDALAFDTFFVLKNSLVFVANKTQLLVYELF